MLKAVANGARHPFVLVQADEVTPTEFDSQLLVQLFPRLSTVGE